MSDPVNHPAHYSADRFGIECIEFTRHMSFNVGNAFKYVWRHLDKGTPEQDLRKALVYIGWAIEDRTPAYVKASSIEHVVALTSVHIIPPLMSGEQPEVFWALTGLIFNRAEAARDHLTHALKELS